MRCRLRSYDTVIPGGLIYDQPYNGGVKHFAGPLIETLAQAVAGFRSGNNLPRATPKEALIDIDQFNAMRLGCHKKYTVMLDSNNQQQTALNSAISPTITPCKGCGGHVLQG
jgi:hypothetical protein